MATIEGHPDFGVLETRLIDLVRAVRENERSGPFARLAIVAPTGRLLTHLRQVLAASLRSQLNVHFLHHDALLREVAAAADVDLPHPLAAHARQALLAHLAGECGGPLAEYVSLRPGSAAALRRTIDDLREAGLDAESRPAGLSHGGTELMRLYARYSAAMERLSRHRLGDRSARIKSVLPHVAPFARRFSLVLHYGAYDLIGINLDLLHAIDASGTPLIFLIPFHPTAPAYAHARRFWPAAFGASPSLLPDQPGTRRLLGGRLTSLYDEEADPGPVDDGSVRMFHTQGAMAELRETAMRILDLHRRQGVPLHRIAIIARSLEPYTPHLHGLFSRYSLPFDTSAARGCLRDGVVQAVLQLSRAVLGDYERQPLMDLLRGGQLSCGDRDTWRDGQAYDRLSRDYRVARGFRSWTRSLPESIGRMEPDPREAEDEETAGRRAAFIDWRRRQARDLATIVKRMQQAAAPAVRARSWRDWSRAMSTMCLDLLRGFHPSEDADPADGAVLVMAIFDEMESLDAAGVPFTTRSAAAHLQRALAGESMPIGSVTAAGDSWPGDNGGVRVLDTMQARGLGFEAVFLIGFNADLLPRRPHPDPLLDDADRTLLRGRGGRPLPLGSMARDEERLLLAHMLGSAEGRLTLSWQRADESGKARVQSLALREVSRLTFGGTELERIRERAERIPAHPLDLGRRAAGRWGLLPAPEARINAALQLADPGRLRRVLAALPAASAADRPIIEAGLTMLGIIEDFASPDLRFDGFVAAAAPLPAIWSPSRLEQLGNCPQQYFFRHVLQVDEPADPLTDYEVPLADLGRHVHRVLHLVYRELVDGGTLRGGGDVATRAESILDRVWESESSGLAALVGGRYPLLWAEMSRQWRDALRAFLRADVAEVAGDGEITGLEEPIAIPLGVDLRGIEIEMRGRFDRIRRVSANEFLVSDYKTSGKPRSHVDVTAALKGRRLQMPLYVLMAEARQAAAGTPDPAVRAEVLGVGPGYLRDGTTWDEETGRATLEQRTFAPHRGAFAETIAVLVHLAAAGFFPFDDHDPMICGYCPFVRACRRGQAPAATRLAAADAGRDYFRLRNKSTRAPLLPSRPATAGDGRDS